MLKLPESPSRLLPSRKTLVDGVYDAILALLMDQVIEPGARAGIDDIARRLEVSPTPVREALVRLESDGLVTKQSQKGYRAAKLLDYDSLRQLYEMREILEPAGAKLAAAKIAPDTLKALRELLAGMQDEVNSKPSGDEKYASYRTFADQDANFHRLIAANSGNVLLSDAVYRLRAHTHLYRLYFKHGLANETSHEHETILTALSNNDPAAAEEAMHRHLAESYARMARQIA